MTEKIKLKEGMSAGVLGFGRAGQAVCRYLAAQKLSVLVSDRRQRADLSQAEQQIITQTGARYQGGGHGADFFKGCAFVIKSPGVDPQQRLAREIRALPVPLLGELALAAGRFEVPVIAVTGSNGKTTVTELIGALLKAAGYSVFVGGNIGTPLFEYFLDHSAFDAVVLEISSFQLESCGSFIADVAVLLNITPDHLDRHGSMAHYARAKMKVFASEDQQRLAIINGDDPLIGAYLNLAARQQFCRFGVEPESQVLVGKAEVVARVGGSAQSYRLAGGDLATLTGCYNSAAAILATQPFDLPHRSVTQVLRSFKTGPHRLELVATIKGVRYINDSKATNTGAVKSALGQFDSGVILIAGGSDKGDDFRLLREAVARCVKQLVVIGNSATHLIDALADIVAAERAETLEDAVLRAADMAVAGDVVLLSPACASFDMFRSYTERGRVFKTSVHRLAGVEPTA